MIEAEQHKKNTYKYLAIGPGLEIGHEE